MSCTPARPNAKELDLRGSGGAGTLATVESLALLEGRCEIVSVESNAAAFEGLRIAANSARADLSGCGVPRATTPISRSQRGRNDMAVRRLQRLRSCEMRAQLRELFAFVFIEFVLLDTVGGFQRQRRILHREVNARQLKPV